MATKTHEKRVVAALDAHTHGQFKALCARKNQTIAQRLLNFVLRDLAADKAGK